MSYFQNTVKKYGLEKFIRLRHQVERAEWLDDEGLWKVIVTDLKTGEQIVDHAEIFVNAMGFLKYVGYELNETSLLTALPK